MMRRASLAMALAFLGVVLGACDDDLEDAVVVGVQCPSPYTNGGATIEPGPDGGTASFVYGTSCAPCAPDDPTRYDERGCPVYVTPASCGGDICLFGRAVILDVADDAGADDAGEEDGGA